MNMLKVHKAYKFRLSPNKEQRMSLFAAANGCKFVWNWFLAQRKDLYKACGKFVSYEDQANQLKYLKSFHPWLKSAPSQALQHTLKDLDVAFKNFFKGGGYPRFKKKGFDVGLHIPQGFRVCNNYVFLPKFGEMKFWLSRKIKGDIKYLTLSYRGNHWYVSFCCELEQELPVGVGKPVGLDLGVVRFVTCSDGGKSDPIDFKKLLRKKKKYQRVLSRRKRGSRNYLKAKLRLRNVHVRIASKRSDYLHKLSTTLSKSHAVVIVEDLQIKKMTASASGDVEHPGVDVARKAGLNQSILLQGWCEFVRQLGYKLAWRCGILIKVDPKDTSRHCYKCGHVAKENRLSQAVFCCVACGHTEDADLVGAKNVLEKGMKILHALMAVGQTVAACESNPLGSEAGTLGNSMLPGIPPL